MRQLSLALFFLSVALLCLTSSAAFAQRPARMEQPSSPEVHKDRRVTFRVKAPGGSVNLPGFTLEKNQQKTVNLSDHRSIIPAGVSEGGYVVSSRDRRTGRLAIKQHVISANERLALPFYGSYVYVVALYMDNTNLATLKVGETTNVNLWLQWSDSSQESCTWCGDSTSNSSIATIGGTSATRTIEGVGGGIAYVQALSWEIINSQGSQGWIFSLQKEIKVRVPYRIIEAGVVEQGAATCPSGQAGWSKQVVLQLLDNFGAAYQVAGITVADVITIQTPNPLNVAGTQTGSGSTSSDGAWLDGYYVCSPNCPTSGVAEAIQTWTYNGISLPRNNYITYGCSGITIQ